MRRNASGTLGRGPRARLPILETEQIAFVALTAMESIAFVVIIVRARGLLRVVGIGRVYDQFFRLGSRQDEWRIRRRGHIVSINARLEQMERALRARSSFSSQICKFVSCARVIGESRCARKSCKCAACERWFDGLYTRRFFISRDVSAVLFHEAPAGLDCTLKVAILLRQRCQRRRHIFRDAGLGSGVSEAPLCGAAGLRRYVWDGARHCDRRCPRPRDVARCTHAASDRAAKCVLMHRAAETHTFITKVIPRVPRMYTGRSTYPRIP